MEKAESMLSQKLFVLHVLYVVGFFCFFLEKLNVTDSVINKVTGKFRQKEADM